MKRKLIYILVAVMSLMLLAGCGSASTADSAGNVSTAADETEYLSGKINAKIEVEGYGTISLELDADVAPITVTNFVNLAKSGFYDGLTFHRIMSGFMIQGGDPNHDGTGGSSQKIKGEFSRNGIKNSISHKRGVLSMARSASSYDSASSQFFIMHKDNSSLDGKYAAFGYVTDGMDVVDAICENVKPTDDNGTVPYENQPVIARVTIE
jgi:peptidyl-prolyl cis-trans isomerase B (cyclophilin B)